MSDYGIGAVALIDRWIARERELRAKETDKALREAGTVARMRREAQEALGLVADPAEIMREHGISDPLAESLALQPELSRTAEIILAAQARLAAGL